jgi:hypothetical protein
MERVFGGHIIAPPQPEVSAKRLQQALAAAPGPRACSA